MKSIYLNEKLKLHNKILMQESMLNEKLKLHNKILMQESMLNGDYYPINISHFCYFEIATSLLIFSKKIFTTNRKNVQ